MKLRPGMLLRSETGIIDINGDEVSEVYLLVRPLTDSDAWSASRHDGGWLVLAGEEILRLSDYFLFNFCGEINGT